MATENAGLTKIAHSLLLLNQQRATGELVITHGKQSLLQWKIYFYLGRIVYATGGTHPVRRWYRAFKHNCPECFSTNWLIQAQSEVELWELDLLNQALAQKRIGSTEYKAVLQNIIHEVMFVVVGQKFFTTQWHAGVRIPQQHIFLSVESLIQDAQTLRKQWRDCGLSFLQELMSQFSPDLSPVLRSRLQLESQVSPSAYKSMLRLMRGQHTLWDLAIEMQRPLPVVVRSLLPWIHRGIVELKEVPDLPALCSKPIPVPSFAAAAFTPLIACIDADPNVSQTLTQVMHPLGGHVLTILNPLRDLATLMERKPHLIFLDPAISNSNSYELCTLLRKTADFQDIPIIILTHHDGMVDRMRARLAGASEFLAKPLEPAKVQQIAQKYLNALTQSNPDSPLPSDWATA
jgi:chemotaxis family two-component system response regulator PixG